MWPIAADNLDVEFQKPIWFRLQNVGKVAQERNGSSKKAQHAPKHATASRKPAPRHQLLSTSRTR